MRTGARAVRENSPSSAVRAISRGEIPQSGIPSGFMNNMESEIEIKMPKVNKRILRWARETIGLSVGEAARKLGIRDGKTASAGEKLAAYEDGAKDPSESMLVRMSRVYRRPLLTFYLNSPPRKGDRGRDFRTFPRNGFLTGEHFYVDVIIRDVKARQRALKEFLVDEDEAEPLAFIGKNTMDHGLKKVARTIREIIDIDLEEYRRQSSHREAFKVLREKTEASGIFVLLKGNLGSHHTNIATTVFRSFSLSDEIAPFIVINDLDDSAAWSFTLLRGIVHLVLGQTGVSGSYEESAGGVERFCNDVASELLLPEDDFEAFVPPGSEFEKIRNYIEDYAFPRKVSGTHVAYRLYRRGGINGKLWIQLRDFYKDKRHRYKERKREKSGGPDYYVVSSFKLGSLAPLVKRLTYSKIFTTTKAAMLLDVKPPAVHRLFEETADLS